MSNAKSEGIVRIAEDASGFYRMS